jgi:hypothetical protein
MTYGTVENHVSIYETDLPLDGYQLFMDEVQAISEERLMAYTKTIMVNSSP